MSNNTNITITNVTYSRVCNRLYQLIDSKSNLLDLTKLTVKTSDIISENNLFYVRHIMRNESIEESVKYIISNKKYASYKLLELLNLTLIDIFREDIFTPTIFNIFGCPLSTDIDIAIIVPKIVNIIFLDMSTIQNQENC
jgi:hypothetical protein